jgi:hypothetical protein
MKALTAALLLVLSTSALAKDSCEEGWTPTNKGFCYQIGQVTPDEGMGGTMVDVQVKSPKNYQHVMLTLAIYKGKKLLCTGPVIVSSIEKGEEAAAKGMCMKAVADYDRVTLRVDNTM